MEVFGDFVVAFASGRCCLFPHLSRKNLISWVEEILGKSWSRNGFLKRPREALNG